MKRCARLLLRLYPGRWRRRYEDEYAALLDDLELRLTDLLDMVLHACLAHVRLRATGLQQLVAVVLFFAIEVHAISTGVTENIFWIPDGVLSSALLLAVVTSIGIAIRPVVLWAGRRVAAASARVGSATARRRRDDVREVGGDPFTTR